MEQTIKIVSVFEFNEDERNRLVFSDPNKVRLDPQMHRLALKRVPVQRMQSLGFPIEYPTDENLYVKTWLTRPNAMTQCIGFDCWADVPKGTSLGFRLSRDGAEQLWWDGSDWSPAAAGEWNTVEEVNVNINDLEFTDKSIQVIVNLKTTDKAATPFVYGVAVLCDAFFDPEYDLVFDTLIPFLSSIRPVKDWSFELIADTNTMEFAAGKDYSVEPFDIVDVVGAYDHTNDPAHQTNIAQSYNPTTKTLTLDDDYTAGTRIWVRFSYKLPVAIHTHQDFTHVEKLPSIIIDDIDVLFPSQMHGYTAVRDRENSTAVCVRGPFRATMRYTLLIMADRQRDTAAIQTALAKKVASQQILVSYATGDEYTLRMHRHTGAAGKSNLSDIVEKKLQLDILDVCYWTEGTRSANVVTTGLIGSGDVTFRSGAV